jgi:hypothetical protein
VVEGNCLFARGKWWVRHVWDRWCRIGKGWGKEGCGLEWVGHGRGGKQWVWIGIGKESLHALSGWKFDTR